jgi:uncharacterized membrane protein YeaQ/YmgE (transglycosylase-associated protein family)
LFTKPVTAATSPSPADARLPLVELLEYLLILFVSGLIIGALARLIVPGTGGMGLFATALAGIGGSLLGGLVVRYLVDPKEDWVGILIAVLCAALIVAFFAPGRSGRGAR